MRHLLTTEGMEREALESLLDDADEFAEVLERPIPKVPALRGKTVATLFFEASTRTRMSFEKAAKALSADTMSFSPGTSSLTKGESLKDTVLTIRAMGVDAMVVRHTATGAAWRVAEWAEVPVINGGDGAHQHPTQALLDCLTLRQRFGGLDGLRIGIVGDIRHSRVARSDVYAMTTLGAEVALVAPPTLLPFDTTGWPVSTTSDFDGLLTELDAVYLLRVQSERGGSSVFPSYAEYRQRFGMTKRRLDMLKPDTVVLHPGPMIRGVEIDAEVADDPRCLVLDQVANGVAVRMAALFQLLGGAMSELLIGGGTVLTEGGPVVADVHTVDGVIAAIGPAISAPDAVRIEAAGCWVGPGLVDLHAHLREPGEEHKEDIASGSAAAAWGGYTAVVAMPNTLPPVDAGHMARFVADRGAGVGLVDVVPAGCISEGRQGQKLAHLDDLWEAGVRMFTDDGDTVADAGLLRRAMEYVAQLGGVVAQHAIDPGLAAGGHMHEGPLSSRLGMQGIPALAEEIIIGRDLALVRLTGARYHVQHVSTAGSVALIAAAKAEGLPVTCEVTPHHLAFDDNSVAGTDPVFKMMPPLRSAADVSALRGALVDGVIDAVATDHAPHAAHEKDVPFEEAPSGVTGLEWAAAVVNDTVDLDMATFFDRLSVRPARIAGLVEHGRIAVAGGPANLVVFDPITVTEARRSVSKSANSPHLGRSWRGAVRATVLRGALTHAGSVTTP